jgi:hypothetical protein
MSSTPYLDKLLSTLNSAKELVKLHEEKIKIANAIPFDKIAYKIIEIKISCLKSAGEIISLNRLINEKEEYFKNYYAIWEKNSIEMENDFDNVLNQCKKLTENNTNLKNIISNIDYKQLESNKEYKVFIYKRLKGLL